MDVCERIGKIIEEENMTVASFAKRIGAGDQTVRGIVVQKRNKPGYDILLKIAQSFSWLSLDWLIMGQGDMRKDEKVNSASEADRLLVSYIKQLNEKIERLVEEKTELRMRYESVGCGSRKIVKQIPTDGDWKNAESTT